MSAGPEERAAEGRRILFVAMQNSPHAARWIRCLEGAGHDVHLFGVSHHDPNPALRVAVLHKPVAPVAPPAPPAPPPPTPLERLRAFAELLREDPRHAATVLAWKLRLARRPPPPPAPLEEPEPEPEPPPVPVLEYRPDASLMPDGDPWAPVPLGAPGAEAPALHGPAVLARLVEELRPDLVHALEFQHAGYLALAARDAMGEGRFPPLLVTNWGSDIFHFGRDPSHASVIRRLLAAADLYSCECQRDVALAREFGFAGHVLPVLPNSGGMDLAAVEPLRNPEPPSRRRQIMVKGYEHFAGRAMRALDALERLAPRLAGYEIVLFSVSAGPWRRAERLAREGKLNIRLIGWATHEGILAEFARSRLYLGVSLSDAISTSVLEAMTMGAFPIQTNTSCCTEWFEDGAGGIAIPPDDPAALDAALLRALDDDALVDSAALRNRRVVEERLDVRVVGPKVHAFYDEAFAALRAAQEPAA